MQALHGACLLPACDDDDAFCPDDPALRIDAAIFIANAFGLVAAPPCDDGTGSTSTGGSEGGGANEAGNESSNSGSGGGPGSGTSAGTSGSPVTNALPGGDTDSGSGCGCRGGSPGPTPWLLVLALPALRRRRADLTSR